MLGRLAGVQIPVAQVEKISFSREPAMIGDEDGRLTGYTYLDLNTKDYGGFGQRIATGCLHSQRQEEAMIEGAVRR